MNAEAALRHRRPTAFFTLPTSQAIKSGGKRIINTRNIVSTLLSNSQSARQSTRRPTHHAKCSVENRSTAIEGELVFDCIGLWLLEARKSSVVGTDLLGAFRDSSAIVDNVGVAVEWLFVAALRPMARAGSMAAGRIYARGIKRPV